MQELTKSSVSSMQHSQGELSRLVKNEGRMRCELTKLVDANVALEQEVALLREVRAVTVLSLLYMKCILLGLIHPHSGRRTRRRHYRTPVSFSRCSYSAAWT